MTHSKTRAMTRTALVGVLAFGLAGAAQAQQIPTPANPTPRFPIATDGTPLPPNGAYNGGLATGRSVGVPAGDFLGLGTAGAVVDGTAGAVGVR